MYKIEALVKGNWTDDAVGAPNEFTNKKDALVAIQALAKIFQCPISDFRATPITNVFNVSQVAVQLGICNSRVRQLAHSRHLGTKLGRIWLFTQADIKAMRVRKPGNPNKHRRPLNLNTAIPWSAL